MKPKPLTLHPKPATRCYRWRGEVQGRRWIRWLRAQGSGFQAQDPSKHYMPIGSHT